MRKYATSPEKSHNYSLPDVSGVKPDVADAADATDAT